MLDESRTLDNALVARHVHPHPDIPSRSTVVAAGASRGATSDVAALAGAALRGPESSLS